MKTARRVLSLLLVLAMVFALVACGGSETTETDSGSKKTTASSKPSGDKDGDDDGDTEVEGNTDSGDVGDTENSGSTNSSPISTGTVSNVVTGDTTISTNTQLTADDFEPDPHNPSDFNGKNYVIIQHEETKNPFAYDQDSLLASEVADRIAEVESKYGCKLVFSQLAYGASFPTEYQGMYLGGEGGDMIFSSNNAMLRRTLGTGPSDSLMTDLLSVDEIINFWDFNKWGNITARETMMSGGVFYGVSPALWLEATPLPFYVVAYNKDLLTQFGLTDPQEFWEKGEWDRDNMLDLITSCSDESSSNPIFGMSALLPHMIRATVLTTGVNMVEIGQIDFPENFKPSDLDSVNVDWSLGLMSYDVVSALQWLRGNLKSYAKYFNYDRISTWDEITPPLKDNQSLFCLTRHLDVFGTSGIATKVPNFGLITWAGLEANTLTGYYENCYSITIPLSAQDAKQTAYLMYDLFKGLAGVETYGDVIQYYRDTYFSSDIDVICLFREGARLQYSYWPNGVDNIYSIIESDFMTASSIPALLQSAEHYRDTEINTYMIPNVAMIEAYRQNGYLPEGQ